MPILFNVIIEVLLVLMFLMSESPIFIGLYCLYALAVIVPSLAMVVRRLHDVGKSGWYYLITLIPLGAFYILYLFVQDSEAKTNQWGRRPKEKREIKKSLPILVGIFYKIHS